VVLDILTLIIVGLGGYLGYTRGILQEIVGLFQFIIAFLISFKLIAVIFQILHLYLFQFHTELMPAILFACTIGATFALLATLGKYLKSEIEYDLPGAWDNIAGGIFGALKYAVNLSFFYWFTMAFGQIAPAYKAESSSYFVVEKVAYTLTGVPDRNGLDGAIRNFVGIGGGQLR
jgi:uncharacterized membrane protein required for colicin V production